MLKFFYDGAQTIASLTAPQVPSTKPSKDSTCWRATTSFVEADSWGDRTRPAVLFRGAAQSPQKFAVGEFSKPQVAHRFLNGAAH
jgi:hypothetical protein